MGRPSNEDLTPQAEDEYGEPIIDEEGERIRKEEENAEEIASIDLADESPEGFK